MNPSRPHRESAADQQAALWAARLDGDILDRSQRTALDAWLAEDPSHRTLLSQYCQFSADLEQQIPALVAAGGVVNLPVRETPAWRTRSRRKFARLASLTLAAAAALVVGFSVLRPSPDVQNIAMASKQRAARTLADGTRVELNANTSLRFENKPTARRVTLAGGEAFFEVSKDPSRPFIVETPAGSVRVTGTTFNVRNDPTRIGFEVTVVEGSVQVHSTAASAAPVPLVAGNQFSSATSIVRTLSADALGAVLAWRQGAIVFDGVPLSEAAARFAHYHGRAIKVAPAVANERVGARHRLDDLNDFLAGIELALPVVRHDEPSGAIVLSRRPGK